jgi:hypothetical protein
MRWLDKDGREQWDIVFKGVQAIGIFVGAIWIAFTYFDTRTRELRKPYDEKQLNFYADAVKVVAHLATEVEDDKAKADGSFARFWELYWGELPLVESPEVRTRMIAFCATRFSSSGLCGTGQDKKTGDERVSAAIAISDAAKCEVKKRWEGKVSAGC